MNNTATPVNIVLSIREIQNLLEAAKAQSKADYGCTKKYCCVVLNLTAVPYTTVARPNELRIESTAMYKATQKIIEDAKRTEAVKAMRAEA